MSPKKVQDTQGFSPKNLNLLPKNSKIFCSQTIGGLKVLEIIVFWITHFRMETANVFSSSTTFRNAAKLWDLHKYI